MVCDGSCLNDKGSQTKTGNQTMKWFSFLVHAPCGEDLPSPVVPLLCCHHATPTILIGQCMHKDSRPSSQKMISENSGIGKGRGGRGRTKEGVNGGRRKGTIHFAKMKCQKERKTWLLVSFWKMYYTNVKHEPNHKPAQFSVLFMVISKFKDWNIYPRSCHWNFMAVREFRKVTMFFPGPYWDKLRLIKQMDMQQ